MPSPATVPAATGLPREQLLGLEQLVGERTVPGLGPENYWFRRHEAAYLALAPQVATAGPVLEAGSGEGYGVQLLHRAGAERVIALDYDAAALAHARSAYPAEIAGRALRSNLAVLPLANAGVAAVTCFQVIEHLWTPEQFLTECARVLIPGGWLVVTTPDRLTFSPGLGRGQKPANPFHHREFDAVELHDLIAEQFDVTQQLGVRHGPRLRAWAARHGDPIAAQLASAPDAWPGPLRELVASVTAADFTVDELIEDDETVLDLVVTARKRAPHPGPTPAAQR